MHIPDSMVLENSNRLSSRDFVEVKTETNSFEVRESEMEFPEVSCLSCHSVDTRAKMSREVPTESTEGSVSEEFVLDRTGVKSNNNTVGHRENVNRPLYFRLQSFDLQNLSKYAKDDSKSLQPYIGKTARIKEGTGKTPDHVPARNLPPRYHVEDDLRFAKMKPGFISQSLRTALGIDDNQLPLYIYRMRELGYPPGHLQSASQKQSGILVFAAGGCEVTPSGDILEEGELSEEKNNGVSYDVSQLIEFPGFNIDPPVGTLDECRRLNFPYMQEKQRKDVMVKMLLSSGPERENALKELIFSEGKEREIPIELDGESTGVAKLFSAEQNSAWLAEMGLDAADGWRVLDAFTEAEEDRTLSKSSSPSKFVSSNSILDATRKGSQVNLTGLSQVAPGSLHRAHSSPQSPSNGSDVGGTPKRAEEYGQSLDISSGTPVKADDTFWSKVLPDALLFSAGMTEELHYENPPNATGSFQKLRKVLKDARVRADCPYLRR